MCCNCNYLMVDWCARSRNVIAPSADIHSHPACRSVLKALFSACQNLPISTYTKLHQQFSTSSYNCGSELLLCDVAMTASMTVTSAVADLLLHLWRLPLDGSGLVIKRRFKSPFWNSTTKDYEQLLDSRGQGALLLLLNFWKQSNTVPGRQLMLIKYLWQHLGEHWLLRLPWSLLFTGDAGDNKIHRRVSSGHVRAGWEAQKK